MQSLEPITSCIGPMAHVRVDELLDSAWRTGKSQAFKLQGPLKGGDFENLKQFDAPWRYCCNISSRSLPVARAETHPYIQSFVAGCNLCWAPNEERVTKASVARWLGLLGLGADSRARNPDGVPVGSSVGTRGGSRGPGSRKPRVWKSGSGTDQPWRSNPFSNV
jgi:hypothetical protein